MQMQKKTKNIRLESIEAEAVDMRSKWSTLVYSSDSSEFDALLILFP